MVSNLTEIANKRNKIPKKLLTIIYINGILYIVSRHKINKN